MKLRNKKTGKVQTCDFMVISDDSSRDGEIARLNSHVFIFRSIEQLNEEYEDYKPTEPLIKDEKIRKAVRAWADANDFTNEIEVRSLNAGTRFSEGHWSIEFIGYFIYDLKIGSTYTIAELCGEEE